MTRLGLPLSYSQAESRLFGKMLAFVGLSKMAGAPQFDKLGDDAPEIRAALAAQATKSGVGGVEYGTPSETPAWSSIAQGTFDQTILGMIPGTRRGPFQHKIAAGAILGTGAAWRAEGKAIRVAPVTFAGVALPRNSIGGIVAATREFLELAIRDNTSAETLSRLMRDAIRREADSVFCGSNAAVAGQQPAGLGSGTQSVASTGATAAAIAADIRSMVAKMVGGGVPLRSAVWVLSSEAHALIATSRLIDESGDTIAGRPFVTDAPSGTFLLVAADFLSYAVSDSVAAAVATSSIIEMDSGPSGDSLTPAAAANNRISLFQSDAIAIKGLLDVSWQLLGPSDSNGLFAAVALTGASYA